MAIRADSSALTPTASSRVYPGLSDSRAIQLKRIFDQLAVPQTRLAAWMGVSENTLSRWMVKAKSDAAGRPSAHGREPEWSRIIHARTLLALSHTCPGMCARLAWDETHFQDALEDIDGPALKMRSDRTGISSPKE